MSTSHETPCILLGTLLCVMEFVWTRDWTREFVNCWFILWAIVKTRRRHSSVGTVTRLQATWSNELCFDYNRNFFPLPVIADRYRQRQEVSLFSTGLERLLSLPTHPPTHTPSYPVGTRRKWGIRGGSVTLTTYVRLISSIRTSGGIPPFPAVSLWRAKQPKTLTHFKIIVWHTIPAFTRRNERLSHSIVFQYPAVSTVSL